MFHHPAIFAEMENENCLFMTRCNIQGTAFFFVVRRVLSNDQVITCTKKMSQAITVDRGKKETTYL